MKKAIVTTTINPPTAALIQFIKIARRDKWHVFIVGDQKTPHEAYEGIQKINPDYVTYIGPEKQEAISKELSDLIGWNCIQRRNFGFVAAYQAGAQIIATVDDDNIPLKNWGKQLTVGKLVIPKLYGTEQIVFDPLAATNQGPNIWHRGFPIQLLKEKNKLTDLGKPEGRRIWVQADLWQGDPDIDAICRIAKNPNVTFNVAEPYGSNKPMPFNSQNTFLQREVMPWYFMWPHIGRMDDIWAAYFVQRYRPDSVVFGPASVEQKRNEHDLVKDLDAEMIGYHHTLDWIKWCFETEGQAVPDFMPADSIKAYEIYRGLLNAKTETEEAI